MTSEAVPAAVEAPQVGEASAEGAAPMVVEETAREDEAVAPPGEAPTHSTSDRPGVMKRARWGATHRIHEHFVDGFPELEERFVREREAAERRFEYNLGSRNFASKREGEQGIDTLKVLFRKLDRAIGLRDANMVQSIREEFLAELRHWNWRKGARVEFKRRKLVQSNAARDGRTKQLLPAAGDDLMPEPPAPDEVREVRPVVKREDDSSVDDLEADDLNAIDDRVRRVSPAPTESKDLPSKVVEKLQVADARRHVIAETVAVALVTLKWRAMGPNDLDQLRTTNNLDTMAAAATALSAVEDAAAKLAAKQPQPAET